MKKFITLFVLIIFTCTVDAQLVHQWSYGFGHGYSNEVKAMCLDSQSNLILALWTGDTTHVDIDPGPDSAFFYGKSTGDIMNIAKYDKNGNFKWIKRIESTTLGYIQCYQINVDGNGNIYLVGNFSGTIDVDPDTGSYLLNGGRTFISKYDSLGNLLFAGQIVGSQCVAPYGFDSEDDGTFYLAGSISCGSANFSLNGGTNILSSSVYKPFIVKYNPDGSVNYSKLLQSAGGSACNDFAGKIKIDQDKNLWVTFSTCVSFDYSSIGTYLPAGDVIAKYDSLGNLILAKWICSWSVDHTIYNINCDVNNRVVISGGLHTTIDANPDSGTYILNCNSGNQSFYIIFDSTGSFITANTFGLQTSSYLTNAVLDDSANIIVSGFFASDFMPEGTSGISQVTCSGVGDIFIGKFNSNNKNIFLNRIGGETSLDWARPVILNKNELYIGGMYSGNADFDFSNNIVYHYATGYTDFFIAKYLLNETSNRITGNVFTDYNNDSLKNVDEYGLSDVIIRLNPGPKFYSTYPNGDYSIYVDTGTYTLSIPSPPVYYQDVNPPQRAVDFSSSSQIDSSNDFGIVPLENINDLRIDVTNMQPCRPGFPVDFMITCKNKGTVPLPASIQLQFDTALIFSSSSLPEDSTNQNIIYWNLDTVFPSQQNSFIVHFTLHPATANGILLNSIATAFPVAGDATPSDNIDSLNNIVTSSYDPNSKAVSRNWVTLQEVQDTVYVNYIIRFQNTGTDTAFFVNIIDTLKSKIDLASFEMLSSSHPCTWHLENRDVLFAFKNINLPDSNINELASHGFVKFRVRLKNTLPIGTEVHNKAYIYFDYNQPVATNIAVTTVINLSSIEELNDKTAIEIYPNPNNGNFTLQLNNSPHKNLTIKITDQLGRIVFEKNYHDSSTEISIVLKQIPQGIYNLMMNDGGQIISKKVCVMR
ncbi:MAG: T9SS type A sorting domain-containing protein [Bacteroidia bacterium]